MQKIRILPSLLAADFAALGEAAQNAAAAGGDMLHLDIMDGHFVPNISFGPDVVKALRAHTRVPFDTHLMIAPADPYLEAFAQAGSDCISVHVEAGPHIYRNLQAIRALGKKAGVALNPGTPLTFLDPLLDVVDFILLMTVNPGFGGQSFIPAMLDKIRRTREKIAGRPIALEVDGGITPETAGPCAAAGANWLVAGSAVFKDGPAAYGKNIAAIRQAAENAIGISI